MALRNLGADLFSLAEYILLGLSMAIACLVFLIGCAWLVCIGATGTPLDEWGQSHDHE